MEVPNMGGRKGWLQYLPLVILLVVLPASLVSAQQLEPRFFSNSIDFGYGEGGEWEVSGVASGNTQRNYRFGSTFSLPLGGGHSIKAVFATGLARGFGSDFDAVVPIYQYYLGSQMRRALAGIPLVREPVLALLTPSASAQIVNTTLGRLTLTSGLSKGFANDDNANRRFQFANGDWATGIVFGISLPGMPWTERDTLGFSVGYEYNRSQKAADISFDLGIGFAI
jgi:hypothetical protein